MSAFWPKADVRGIINTLTLLVNGHTQPIFPRAALLRVPSSLYVFNLLKYCLHTQNLLTHSDTGLFCPWQINDKGQIAM
jgi:hypothetical protein